MRLSVAALFLSLLSTSPALAADFLISAADAKAAAADGKTRFVFGGSEKAFAKEHIPGSAEAYAHDLHYLDDIKKCDGLPMCEATAGKFIGTRLGIGADTPVIVYDDGAGANASGVWFFLKLYGVNDVKILDGGLAAWKAAGGAVEKGHAKAMPAQAFTPKVDRSMIATKAEVLQATKDPAHYLLVDARHKLGQYTGKELQTALDSPGHESTVKRGGFIPGAVYSPWSKFAGNKRAKPGKPTFKDDKKLKKQLKKLEKAGYAPNKTVISYCHVGLGRGSFQYLALKKAGHEKVKLYVGSWNEWGNDPDLPVGKPQL